MRIVTTLLLALTYPLLVVARLVDVLLRRDPLRLREPGGESLWIPRAAQPDSTSYFSESSVAEGKGAGGFGWIAAAPLRWQSRLFGGRRQSPGANYAPAADREQGIPDEVYTLW